MTFDDEHDPQSDTIRDLRAKLRDTEDELQTAEDELQAAEDELQAAEAEVARMREEGTKDRARFTEIQEKKDAMLGRTSVRIAELEAELATEREAYREWYGKAGDDGAPATWDQLKRTATEAALRWAIGHPQWECPTTDDMDEHWITRGLAALLNETNNQGETK